MTPWMAPAEERAFRSFLVPGVNLLEFGCGGSTVAAATSTSGHVVSIDSSVEWLAKVGEALAAAKPTAAVSLRHVDIGPVGEAGYPVDNQHLANWPRYHNDVWDDRAAEEFDLFLIDGRFRVACFVQAIMRCRPDAVILFHDYASRANYHAVETVAREVFREQELSAFVRRRDFDVGTARHLLDAHSRSAG